MATPFRIMADNRPIDRIDFMDEQGSHYKVGSSGVTHIQAYEENGEMASIVWIAVFKEGQIWARVPSRMVTISYKV